MLTSETTIAVDRPSRYLTQLCNHASSMGATRGGHSPRNHATGGALARGELQVHVESSEHEGVIAIEPLGQCALQAGDGILTVRVEGRDEAALRAIQDIVTRDLERFGRREQLTVTWPSMTAVRVAGVEEQSGTEARPRWLGLVLLALLVVAALLVRVAGATILASVGWARVSLEVVLALAAVKVLLVLFGGRLWRHGRLQRRHWHNHGGNPHAEAARQPADIQRPAR